MNGDRMELFMDGEETPPLSVDPDHPIQASQFLLGRLTTVPRHTDTWSRPFVGRLDEVALYHRPLTVEEVRRHYRLGSGRAARGDRPAAPGHAVAKSAGLLIGVRRAAGPGPPVRPRTWRARFPHEPIACNAASDGRREAPGASEAGLPAATVGDPRDSSSR